MKATQDLLLNMLPDTGQAGITTVQLRERLRVRAIDVKWLKSIRRVLQRLEDEGLACSKRQGRHLYWWKYQGVAGFSATAYRRMTLGEALALRVLSMAAQAYPLPWAVQSELQPLLQTAMDRLEKTPMGNEYGRWPDRIAVLDEGFHRLAPPVDPSVAETLSMALFRARQLTLQYDPASGAAKGGGRRKRLVEPLGWVSRNKLHYLVARRPDTQDIRHYRVDRIRSATVGRSFLYPRDFSLQAHIEEDSAFDYPGQGAEIEVVLRFDRDWGAHLLETPVNNSQSVLEDTDATLTVKFRSRDSERLLWWIRSFGPHVEVLSPARLRLVLLEEAKAAARMYQRMD